MTDHETIKRLHMRDGRHNLDAAEERDDARAIGWITIFYMVILIIAALVYI